MTLADAVELLEKGDWKGAHSIARKEKTPLGSWAHGIVHTRRAAETGLGTEPA